MQMSNLAIASFRVEWHGSYWIVFTGNGNFVSVQSGRNLSRVLRGLDPVDAGKPKAQFESVDSFLARGGSIKKVTAKDSANWSLESLGLLGPNPFEVKGA